MQTKDEELNLKLLKIKDEITNQSKRALKKAIPKTDSVRQDIRDQLVSLFNSFTKIIARSWDSLDTLDKNICKQLFLKVRDKIVRSFQSLGVRYKIPYSCIEIINPLVLDEETPEDEDEIVENMAMSVVDFFNLAGKLVPNQFDGSPDKLLSFLDSLELLKNNSTNHADNALAFVKTRLTGKARDLITNEHTITEIINKLKSGIKGESSRLLLAKLNNTKQNNKDPASYATDVECLAEKLKRAYITEGVPCELAENYTVEATARAVSQNASSEKARLVVEAGTFSTVQELVTKFVNITPQPTSSSNIFYVNQNRQFRHSGNWRSRGQQNVAYRHNGNNNAGYSRGRPYRGNRTYRGNNHRNNAVAGRYNNRNVRYTETETDSENQSGPQRVRLGEM